MFKSRNTIPKLRFPEFGKEWQESKIDKIFDRVVNSVEVEKDKEYQQIGIRSHGKGIFHKDFVLGSKLGNKRVFWIEKKLFIVNIVFAWEMAVAKTTKEEIGLIASHRFPMYKPKQDILDLDYILYFFLRKRGKYILELASPGGAGRNKTLGQSAFAKSKVTISQSILEQQKIAKFLSSVDSKIEQLTKKKQLLEQYKKGVMQQIFSQQLRFKKEDGSDFPDWEEKMLGEVATITMGQSPDSKTYNTNRNGKPLIQGNADIQNRKSNPRNWTSEITKECFIGDLILTVRAPVGAISKSHHNACIGRGVCAIRNKIISDMEFLYQFLLGYESKWTRLEQGSTFTAVNGKDIKSIKIDFPDLEEQTQIANFLSAIDAKIELVNTELEKTQEFKKGLFQQMFV